VDTHKIIADNFHQSIHIRETVKGPRYCPSIESKIQRFTQKESHIIWLEPEGFDTDLVYPNGISNTMPEDIQLKFLRTIKGLENVDMVRPGKLQPKLSVHNISLILKSNIWFSIWRGIRLC
jgi:tRNA uridine 5-carboxymethylaminomethyl modification enzyme